MSSAAAQSQTDLESQHGNLSFRRLRPLNHAARPHYFSDSSLGASFE